MNQFWISKVLAACDRYLATANTFSDVVRFKHATALRRYVAALASDDKVLVNLTIEDLDFIADDYAKITLETY